MNLGKLNENAGALLLKRFIASKDTKKQTIKMNQVLEENAPTVDFTMLQDTAQFTAKHATIEKTKPFFIGL